MNRLATHKKAFKQSYRRLLATPLTSLLTIAVIAIAFALPAALSVLLDNAKTVSKAWDSGTQISLFLKKDIKMRELDDLMESLRSATDVGEIIYISPEKGLKEFQAQSGFRDVLAQLPENPLPAVLEVHPAVDSQDQASIETLVGRLEKMSQVDSAQLDMQWLKRLNAIIFFLQQAVSSLSILLAAGVLLVVGNTIRTAIQNRRKEIEVNKLVGATNAFIRRPFLYIGIIYTFGGCLLAFIIIEILLSLLGAPVRQLAGEYNSSFRLHGLSLTTMFDYAIASLALGLVGAWLTVNRHLRAIEPE